MPNKLPNIQYSPAPPLPPPPGKRRWRDGKCQKSSNRRPISAQVVAPTPSLDSF